MTNRSRGTYGSMAHAHWKWLGTYCAWCRKELPNPQLSKVERYCDDQCGQSYEQHQHDQVHPTRHELAAELKDLKERLEAVERAQQDSTVSP